MSQLLELRIKKIVNKRGIEKIIKEFGFKKISKNEFYFYEEKDFLSLGSIHLNIIFENSRTIISTYSSGLRYYYDIKQQNDIIRQLKKKYGGYIYNDWTKGTYIKGWEETKLNVLERACGLAYHKYYGLLMRALTISGKIEKEIDEDFLAKMMPDSNISLLIIPFLVSGLEDFLKTFFIRFLNYSKNYKKNEKNKIDRKLSISELDQIYNNDITIGDLIAEKYNFQNIKSFIQAYNDYCDLDLYKLLNKKKKVGSGKLFNLYTELKNIINLRHKIIHEADFILIKKSDILNYIDIFFIIGKEIVTFYKKKYNYTFDLNSI